MSLDTSVVTLPTQPVIETERFDLRPLRQSDMGMIEHYGSDERLARMTVSIPHPLPPGMVEAFVARVLSPDSAEKVWVMDSTKMGGPELMGAISLECMDRNQCEVSYWVAPPFSNTGVASDAVRALVDANPLGSATMFASVFQDNPASARVLTNCGFEYIGDAEAFCVARDSKVQTWTYVNKL